MDWLFLLSEEEPPEHLGHHQSGLRLQTPILEPGTYLPTQERELKDINFKANITFEKPLMYDQNMGWNWHKSWNIPDITVELLVDYLILRPTIIKPSKLLEILDGYMYILLHPGLNLYRQTSDL